LQKYYLGQLKALWPYLLSNHDRIYELKEGNFSNKNIRPARLSPDRVTLSFNVLEDKRFITISQQLIKNEKVIESKNLEILSGGIFLIDDLLHLPDNIDDLEVLLQFQHGFIKIPVTNKLSVITNMIPVLQKKYEVHLPPSMQLKIIEAEPKPRVLMKEFNTQYLMLQPQFVYEEATVDYESNPQNILQTLPDGSWQVIRRDAAKEKAFLENIRLLHHQFERQRQNDFVYLPFDDVMKNNWFINIVRQLQEKYKMICKNTIEEKIIELQKRKKQIANELVTEDAGFVKKLSKDDIEFLFN